MTSGLTLHALSAVNQPLTSIQPAHGSYNCIFWILNDTAQLCCSHDTSLQYNAMAPVLKQRMSPQLCILPQLCQPPCHSINQLLVSATGFPEAVQVVALCIQIRLEK